jgi:hypothetical protein
MGQNPFDPTKPGQFNDWKNTTEKTGDYGAGANTSYESYIYKPNLPAGSDTGKSKSWWSK